MNILFFPFGMKIELYMGMTNKTDFIKEVKSCEFYIELKK